MICRHVTPAAPRYGALSDCLICHSPIIYNGTKWLWKFAIDDVKVAKMRNAYHVDRMTEKASQTP